MALHEQCVGATDEWYTPPYVFEAMGWPVFDFDVAAAKGANWIRATGYFFENSLEQQWKGFIWMNPPFGGRNAIDPWLAKFETHGNGIALVPDRTSAPWFQRYAPKMDGLLFVSPKIQFIDAAGRPGKSPAQGTCLMAKGPQGMLALLNAQRMGLGMLCAPVWR